MSKSHPGSQTSMPAAAYPSTVRAGIQRRNARQDAHAAIITHGGVMNTLLAVYGLPQAKPFDWACDCGYGYSLRITPMLWMRDKVAEVYDRIPKEREDDVD